MRKTIWPDRWGNQTQVSSDYRSAVSSWYTVASFPPAQYKLLVITCMVTATTQPQVLVLTCNYCGPACYSVCYQQKLCHWANIHWVGMCYHAGEREEEEQFSFHKAAQCYCKPSAISYFLCGVVSMEICSIYVPILTFLFFTSPWPRHCCTNLMEIQHTVRQVSPTVARPKCTQ